MNGLGFDFWNGLTNIDSTAFAPGPSGQSVPWYQQLFNVGIDIYDRVSGQGGYSNNPPYPGMVYNPQAGQYQYPAPAQTNWLPWVVVGGVILFALTRKKR